METSHVELFNSAVADGAIVRDDRAILCLSLIDLVVMRGEESAAKEAAEAAAAKLGRLTPELQAAIQEPEVFDLTAAAGRVLLDGHGLRPYLRAVELASRKATGEPTLASYIGMLHREHAEFATWEERHALQTAWRDMTRA